MPKVGKSSKLQRAARRAAVSEPLPVTGAKKQEADNDDELETPGPQKLSRGQRKRQAKREQYLRKERMILSSLKLKSQEEQRKRIDGLDAIKEALMNTTKEEKNEEEDATKSYPSNKSRQQVLAQEVQHLGLVFQHPAFKENPFGAIQEHLKNTFAQQKDKNESKEKTLREAKAKKKEAQKLSKKEKLESGVIKKKTKKKFKATRSR